MSLEERFLNKTQSVPKYDCPRYLPKSSKDKRCRHYLDGGSCELPDEVQCIEWLKANRPIEKPDLKSKSQTDPKRNELETDLLGYPLSASSSAPRSRPRTSTAPRPPSLSPPSPSTPLWARPRLNGLSSELIESFKQLRTEIHFTSDKGQFWLVPEYRDPSRGEITPEHLALICNALMAFPGATVVAFETISPKNKGENSDEQF